MQDENQNQVTWTDSSDFRPNPSSLRLRKINLNKQNLFLTKALWLLQFCNKTTRPAVCKAFPYYQFNSCWEISPPLFFPDWSVVRVNYSQRFAPRLHLKTHLWPDSQTICLARKVITSLSLQSGPFPINPWAMILYCKKQQLERQKQPKQHQQQ